MSETVYELRQRVARDSGLPPEAAAGWQGEVEDVVVAEALAHAEKTRGATGKREVIRRLTEIGSREDPAAMRLRLARSLGLPSDLWNQMSDRTETPDEAARDVVNLLRRSGDLDAAGKAESKAETLAIDAHLRGTLRPQRSVVVDTDDMNEVLRGLSGRTPAA